MTSNIRISPVTWILIISACAITGYLYWFYTHFDKVIEERDMGAIKEARENPYFAAEKFLSSVGKKAKSEKNYSILDSDLESLDTLIIESSRVGLTKNKRSQIKDWVKSGGFLILLATEIYDDDLKTSRDTFLDELGIRLYDNTGGGKEEDEDLKLTKITFEDTEEETKVDFSDYLYLQDASGNASFIGGNDYSDLFAQYKLGEGMVTVLTDMNIWKNYQMDDYDHAMFLYQLVGGGENILFLYNTVQPTLLSVMFDLIPMIVISFVVMISLMLFTVSWRRGSPRLDDLKINREIMQHIEAAGEFSYQNDSGKSLLLTLMTSLENRLRKSIHQYSRLTPDNKMLKISQLTGMKKNELAELWFSEDETQDAFLRKVLLIRTINKRI